MLNFNNVDKRNKNYTYQNLQKSKSFNSNFAQSKFDYACFRGAHLKSCNFNDCSFIGAEFIGANLKGSTFRNAIFENTVFEGAKVEGVDFKGAIFTNTYFVACDIDSAVHINRGNPEIKIYSEMPYLDLSEPFQEAIEKLMENPFVKKSRVMDTKDQRMNTVSVLLLLDQFSEETLINRLPQLDAVLDRDFYSLSYLVKSINKLIADEL